MEPTFARCACPFEPAWLAGIVVLAAMSLVASAAAQGLERSTRADGSVERLQWVGPDGIALARIRYNAQGQIQELVCGPRPMLGVDRESCGFGGRADVDLHDDNGRRTARLSHLDGLRVGFSVYDRRGALTSSERVDGEQVIRIAHHADGTPSRETVTVAGRRVRETQYDDRGRRRRGTEWDEFGRSAAIDWYPGGEVRRRESRAVFEGAPATAVEEWWPNGQLMSRVTVAADGSPMGLTQRFHEDGAIAAETLHVDGRVVRRREFDRAGRMIVEETFNPDGSQKSSMRREPPGG